jgi:hypothetical protein
VLQKSFLADQQKVLKPLMRFVRGNMGDHILFAQNRPLVRLYVT